MLSGQFLLTLVSAGVFAYTACTQKIPADATIAILTTVFISYFKRDRADDARPTRETTETTTSSTTEAKPL